MMEGSGILAATVALLVVLICGGAAFGQWSDKNECRYAHENSGAETKFVSNHFFSWDCYVKVDGEWIPIDKWRGDSN